MSTLSNLLGLLGAVLIVVGVSMILGPGFAVCVAGVACIGLSYAFATVAADEHERVE